MRGLQKYRSPDCEFVRIAAPMVRYSKLPFRQLVRQLGCDLCYTPMIVASSFLRSDKARDNEFVTNAGDRPLVVQFATNCPQEAAAAASLVAPWCDGVDINSGCPQRWAMQQGLGASLCASPQLLCDIVAAVRLAVPSGCSVSVKLRLCPSVPDTVQLCSRLHAAGADWLTLHCRTPAQRHEAADWSALAAVKAALPHVPLVANGDAFSLEDARRLHGATGCEGVMSARGLLRNPSLFTGAAVTTDACLRSFLSLSLGLGLPFPVFHHHLVQMLESRLGKADTHFFNYLCSVTAVLDFISTRVLQE